MADRRAIVAGPVSNLEIGAGTGGGSDWLIVGPQGIAGATGTGTLNMRVNQDGVGDKTMIIGEQGSTAVGNVVHFFGSTDTLVNGTVKIHGNLQVDGTEDVIGNATFEANALFKGITTFGDDSADQVIFVADVNSDIYFDASAGGRTIGVKVPATGVGTDLTISAGAAFGAGNDNGGNLLLLPANPTGTGTWGAVKIGSASEIDPDGKQGPRMLLNTGSAGEAGFRWNSTDSKLQYRVQSGAWTDLVGGGGVLPPSTDQFQILQANAGGGWNIADFLTLPSTLTGVGRLITVQTQDQANTIGDILTVEAATGNGTGGGGELRLYGGDSPGTGATGGVDLASQVHTTGTTGSVSISTGTVTSGTAGNISMTAGTASLSGTGGDVSIAAGGAQTGGSPGDVSITAGGATGANGGTNGGLVTVTGGSTDDGTGGTVTIAGGAATFGTTGGSIYLRGGASGSGTAGTVWIGDTNTNQIVFGLGGATDNAIYANSDTAADRAGLRYNDTTDKWQYHLDGGGATWTDFGSGTVPDGTINYQILRWDTTGTPAWVATEDLILPSNGGNANIGQEPTDTPSDRLVVQGHASITGTVDAGPLWLFGGDTTGTGDGGGIVIRGGSAGAVGGAGGDVTIDAGFGGDGSPATVWIGGNGGPTVLGNTGATDVAFYANSDTAADRAGIRYNDTTDRWQIHYDGGGATWLDIAAGGSGQALPVGTLNQVLQHDGSVWVAANDFTLPAGAPRSIDIASAATGDSLSVVAGQGTAGPGGSVGIYGGVGSTNGGGAGLLGGLGSAGNGGTVTIDGGSGSVANGDIIIGDNYARQVIFGNTVGTTIDFEGAGTQVISDIVFDDATSKKIYVEANATVGGAISVLGGVGTTAGGSAGLYGGSATTGTGGGAGVFGGAATTGTGGDVSLYPGAGATAYGSTLVGNAASTSSYMLFNTLAAAPAQASGPGFRYTDGNAYMEVWNPTTAQWERIASGGAVLPTGAATGEILEWDQTGTQWLVTQDLALPDGAPRAIGMKPHTAATAAYALTVSGQANTSVGPGTTTGGQLTVKGGDSTAENGGDLVLTGGIGSASNGDILFGDGTNPTNIDFENTSGNRVISDITFLNTGTGSSYTIKPDTAISTNANGLLLGGAQGGVAATGGNGGGTSVLGGIGGTNNAGGTSGNGGTANLLAGTGGAGLTGTAGNGGNVTVYAGDAGAVGTVAGGSGGNLSMKAGAGTGNINGGAASLTGGAAVGTGSAGGVTITGGANSSTGNGGLVTITGGASTGGTAGSVIIDSGAGTTDGSVTIGGTNADSINIGNGANAASFDTTSTPPLLSFNGTSTINLPGASTTAKNFRINGTAVADSVTAPNLDTLTAGPTSDASLLHTHDGLGAMTVSSGEAITVNMLIAMGYNGSNAAKGYQCDITSTPGAGADGPLPIGFATSSVAVDTDFTVKSTGQVTVPAALWQVQPSVTDVGKPVYAYGSAGGVSLTPPASGSGDYRTKVGILKSVVAATSGTIAIQIGDSLLMA